MASMVTDLRTLAQLDKRLVDLHKGLCHHVASSDILIMCSDLYLMEGKRDFECPDISVRVSAEGYNGNSIEKAFTEKAQSIAMYNFAKYTIYGALAGLFLSAGRPSAKLVNVSLGTVIGSTFGVSKATIGIMRHQMELPDSPVAVESRYQLWKIDPNHQWLAGHREEVQRWNRMTYYGGAEGFEDASIDHNESTKSRNIKWKDSDKDSFNDTDVEDQFDDIQQQKRRRFYENRKLLGQNSRDYGHDDHLYDYEQQNRTKERFRRNRNDERDHDEFFHFDSSQTDDRFMESEESIKWS